MIAPSKTLSGVFHSAREAEVKLLESAAAYAATDPDLAAAFRRSAAALFQPIGRPPTDDRRLLTEVEKHMARGKSAFQAAHCVARKVQGANSETLADRLYRKVINREKKDRENIFPVETM